MGRIASQIISLTIVYSAVSSGADQRKHHSSASLAFVRGIHRGPVNSPHKRPVTRKMFHLMTSSCILTKGHVYGQCFHVMTPSCYTRCVNYYLFPPLQCSLIVCLSTEQYMQAENNIVVLSMIHGKYKKMDVSCNSGLCGSDYHRSIHQYNCDLINWFSAVNAVCAFEALLNRNRSMEINSLWPNDVI